MAAKQLSSRKRSVWAMALFAVAAAAACARQAPVSKPPAPAVIPRDAIRFWIASTTDSTVSFRTSNLRWLRQGMVGYAVDPSLHDSLVARVQLIRIHADTVNALITGQLRPVDSTHVVLIQQPRTRWWQNALFWGGTLMGATAATSIALIAR